MARFLRSVRLSGIAALASAGLLLIVHRGIFGPTPSVLNVTASIAGIVVGMIGVIAVAYSVVR